MIGQLVKKDLFFLLSASRRTLAVMILFSICFAINNLAFAYAMPAMVAYIGFYSVLAYEERSKTDLLNLSLPVSRKDICLAKYIEYFIYSIGSCILCCIGVAMGKIGVGFTGLMSEIGQMFLIMLSGALIYGAIIVPCIFYFGTIKARYVLLIIYVLVFVAASSLGAVQGESLNAVFLSGNMGLIVFMVAIIAFCISYIISLGIWNQKEL